MLDPVNFLWRYSWNIANYVIYVSLDQILRKRPLSPWPIFVFVSVHLHLWNCSEISLSIEMGYGVSKRDLKDITCGMGSKTCQNMISIFEYSPLLAHSGNIQHFSKTAMFSTFQHQRAALFSTSIVQHFTLQLVYWCKQIIRKIDVFNCQDQSQNQKS